MTFHIDEHAFDLYEGQVYFAEFETLFVSFVNPDGISRVELKKTLHRNALVRNLSYTASAVRADKTLLKYAGQVRNQEASSGLSIVIVDFGVLRTVSAVGLIAGTSNLEVAGVRTWNGTRFDLSPYPRRSSATTAPTAPSTETVAVFGEVQTTKVELAFFGTGMSLEDISTQVWIRFPDAPSDLELRIDNGPPVWQAPGPAQAGIGGWNDQSERTVDLAAAVAPLLGDPTNDAPVDLSLLLTSRVPGRLALQEQTSTTDIVYLARANLGVENRITLSFEEEGLDVASFVVPSWVASVEEVRLTCSGKFDAERVIPAIGPELATTLGASAIDASVAFLALRPDRKACVRLPAGTGLSQLSGLRLPLRTDAEGAEVLIQLLAVAPETLEPALPLDAQASTPVVLSANADDELWTTFRFPTPVELDVDPDAPPPAWAVVVPTRGNVYWSLGVFDAQETPNPLRRAGAGQWQTLPRRITDAENVGGRVRMIGTAPKALPIAPLRVSAANNAEFPLTPATKPAVFTWKPTTHLTPREVGGQKLLDLTFTCYGSGTYNIDQVEIVASRTET